jgi:hypothetical protein
VSRRTPARARTGNAAEVNKGVSDVSVSSADPKLPIAADFDPPAPAAELPPFEHPPRRRAAK